MSRRPRIGYRDVARRTPGGSEIVAPPGSEPGAGAPPQPHDRPTERAKQHRSDAAGAGSAPSSGSGFAMPILDVGDAPAARPAGTPRSFRDRARARIGAAELLLFRVAGELFAVELSAVEEAMDRPPTHALPEMPPSMRGVFVLRDAPVALYAPNALLGLEPHEAQTVLVFRPGASGRRTALAIDDVDDVFVLDLAVLRDAPGTDGADGILVGVARRGPDLIGVLDADALLAACRSDTVLEIV